MWSGQVSLAGHSLGLYIILLLSASTCMHTAHTGTTLYSYPLHIAHHTLHTLPTTHILYSYPLHITHHTLHTCTHYPPHATHTHAYTHRRIHTRRIHTTRIHTAHLHTTLNTHYAHSWCTGDRLCTTWITRAIAAYCVDIHPSLDTSNVTHIHVLCHRHISSGWLCLMLFLFGVLACWRSFLMMEVYSADAQFADLLRANEIYSW